MKRFIVCLTILSFLFVGWGAAMSAELITNGDFETGNFTEWIVDIIGLDEDTWVINDGTVEFELPPPWEVTVEALDPISGDYDAISDTSAYGQVLFNVSVLAQQIVFLPPSPSNISSATLSWSDRIRNYADDFSDPDDFNIFESQMFGVGLTGNLLDIEFVFSTLPGDPLMQEGPNFRSIDVTEILKSSTSPYVPVSFWVIAEAGPLYVTVDDISLKVYTLDDMAIDIKPGSDPNCFNNDGHGVIPVAILGSADFDVTTIDAGSVELEGLAIKAVGKSNKLLAHYDDVNNDGYYDLVVQIEDTDQVFAEGDTTATVTGNLNDDVSTPFQGSDTICIVP